MPRLSRPLPRTLTLLGGLAGLVLPTALIVPASPAAAEACYPPRHVGPVYELTGTRSTPVVTHAKVINLPPGGTYSKSTTVGRVGSVTAGVTLSSKTSFEVEMIFAKAEQEVGVELQVEGTRTKSDAYTELYKVTNSTAGQKRYVAFFGTQKKSGGVVRTTCDRHTARIVRTRGSWTSWTVVESGLVRCDLATTGVGQKAKALYC